MLIYAAACAGAVVAGFVVRHIVRQREAARVPPRAPPRTIEDEAKSPRPTISVEDMRAQFSIAPGDVLVRNDGHELVLSHAWVLVEERPVAVLVFAEADTVVLWIDGEQRLWLDVCHPPDGFGVIGEAPSTIMLGTRVFQRSRRLPFNVVHVGRTEGAAALEDEVIVGLYEDSHGRVALLAVGRRPWLWEGSRLGPEALLDVWGRADPATPSVD